MTIANAELAQKYFGSYLKSAAAYGEHQTTFAIKKLEDDFYQDALFAVMHLTIDDIRAKHAACLANGAVHPTETADAYAVMLPEADGLVVKLDTGASVLLVMSTHAADDVKDDEDEDKISVGPKFLTRIIPLVDPFPSELRRELLNRLAPGTQTLAQLDDLFPRLLKHGMLPRGISRDLSGDAPMSIEDFLALVQEHGLEQTCKHKDIGSFSIQAFGSRDMKSAHAFMTRDVAPLAAIARAFAWAADNPMDVDSSRHRELIKAVRNGELEALHDSIGAMIMNRHMQVHLDQINQLVRSAGELELSKELRLAYADTDRRVYVQHYSGRDVWVHYNIDMFEQNAMVTILNGEPGAYTSIDAYIAASLNRGDDEDVEKNDGPDAPVDHEAFTDALLRRSQASPRIPELDLHAALAKGELPAAGRILHYDIADQTIEFFPAILATDYLTYVPYMAEGDFQAMQELIDGKYDIEDMWGVEFHKWTEDEDGSWDRETIQLEDRMPQAAPAP